MTTYAIREANDIHGNWWTGTRWAPASDEAKTYESREKAQHHADEIESRECVVVEIED